MTNLLRKRGQKGFTLVELMVVLLIIGILVAIAIPIYNASQASAQKRACQSNLRILDGAAMQYKADYGSFPNNANNTVFKNYIKGNVPKCPTDNSTYGYDSNTGSFNCVHANDGHTYP